MAPALETGHFLRDSHRATLSFLRCQANWTPPVMAADVGWQSTGDVIAVGGHNILQMGLPRQGFHEKSDVILEIWSHDTQKSGPFIILIFLILNDFAFFAPPIPPASWGCAPNPLLFHFVVFNH